jgi:hypothetical protein
MRSTSLILGSVMTLWLVVAPTPPQHTSMSGTTLKVTAWRRAARTTSAQASGAWYGGRIIGT